MGVANKSSGVASKEGSTSATIELKPCWSSDHKIDGNYARQLLIPKQSVLFDLHDTWPTLRLADGRATKVVRDPQHKSSTPALYVPPNAHIENYSSFAEIKNSKWLGDFPPGKPDDVLDSLSGAFEIREDRAESGKPGLRPSQVGALYAVLGYWTTDPQEPATVVMPTGTGKTETMLAIYAHQRLGRLLVLVPSDALREQLAKKFHSYGVLQDFGIVNHRALRPVVGRLGHGMSSTAAAISFAKSCNVVVTTPNALFESTDITRNAFLAQFTHLFVDEAHHLGATTWQSIRDQFEKGKVVQFTATPFREDGQSLKGRMIYAYPLREAQRQGSFSSIDYISVWDDIEPDKAVATSALKRLRADRATGYDHLLMARASNIRRAKELLALYENLAAEFSPVVVHSQAKPVDRRDALTALTSRASRIVICVDMLGEGFDLPQLKVAAIHDPHKSLGITLQFVGRFARGNAALGSAAVVVCRPERGFDRRLHELYAEDADWNKLIRDLSEQAVTEELQDNEFELGFAGGVHGISTRALSPKMSTVVYRTRARHATFSGLSRDIENGSILGAISVNTKECVAWFITQTRSDVTWGSAPELVEQTYDLYVIYWDEFKKLLYINSSNTDCHHEELAKKLCGETTVLVEGSTVYRSMDGINRLVPTNVGLLHVRSHARRFSMHVGANVAEGFPQAEQLTKTQTNIFALGYEGGSRVSIGASLKGRIWSYRVAKSLRQWARWCDEIGAKLLDDSINVDAILQSFIRPAPITIRPDLVFLAAELPWELYLNTRDEIKLECDGQTCPLIDAELRMVTFESSGRVAFEVRTDFWSSVYDVEFSERGMTYLPLSTNEAVVKSARKSWPLNEYFRLKGVTFHLEGDATIVHPSMLLKPNRQLNPFDASKIVALDWGATDLRKESQGPQKHSDSIQSRMIRHVMSQPDWQVVYDDDGSGEMADIVAICASDQVLKIMLVHCKFSAADKPGARVADLYEVCGQAQKSVRWGQNLGLLLGHLIRREKNRSRSARSGFERGDVRLLRTMLDRVRTLRPVFKIAVAQPGLSKAVVSASQLELLASTEVYLHETHLAKFEVFASA